MDGNFGIKSPEELARLRNECAGKIGIRALKKPSHDSNPEITVGMATCGIAAGAEAALGAIRDELKIQGLENVRVVKVGCIGYCHQEPIVQVNMPGLEPVFYGGVNEEKAREIVRRHVKNGECAEGSIADLAFKDTVVQTRIALRNCGIIDPEDICEYIAVGGYEALARALTEMTPDEVVSEIKKSGLRGRGGGGFPTGLKWEITRKAEGSPKYLFCNADEGDPGAFMDRSILEGDPHSVVEAMAIAGYAIGAEQGFVYIRAEYPLALKRLRIALKQAVERGLLGKDILGSGFDFDIDIKIGAGAFVCGEETALIHSAQGLRGEPSYKPPYPSEKGYFGKPTCVNNVETFANISPIITRGASWFSGIGTKKSKGTKVFALAGNVKKVGLVEVPMGTTIREIVFGMGGGVAGGKKLKAVQTGGPSGGVIPEKFIDTPIDYESLKEIDSIMGSGGMIVIDETSCMVDIAKFYVDFTRNESCGRCTPCRIGTTRMHEILEKITSGNAEMEDLSNLWRLGKMVKDSSLCGLGQTAPNPVLSTFKYFMDEYENHVINKYCPAGKCKALQKYEINPEKCVGCTACARKCPVNCISGELKKTHVIDRARCIKCGNCFEACRFGAVVPPGGGGGKPEPH